MELHKKIKETRIQEICDKYIGKSVKGNKPISENDVASLSCAELVVLYYNTEWFIERSNGDSVETGLENQILLMDLIKERVKTSTLYVIYTDATNLPFLTENKSILVYTEKRFADMVACSFNVEYFKESIRFMALEVSESKETYWNKLRASGINTISVDGTKFTVEIDDLVKNKENYENTEFCRFLIQYAQAIRLGIHRDKTSIFQEAILSKLKENPKMIHGSIISKGKNKFIPIYVNASAINETVNTSKLKTENFYALCEEIFENKNITGILLNPEREHIVVPREKILDDFAYLNTKVKSNVAKQSGEEQIKNAIVQCSKCSKLWKIQNLDSNGLCPECIKEKQAKRNANIPVFSSKPLTTKEKCKGCGLLRPSEKINKDGLCTICAYKAQNILSCEKCGKLWHIDKLDSKGVCPECLKGGQKKSGKTTSEISTSAQTDAWVKCKECGDMWLSKSLKFGICPTCVYKKPERMVPCKKCGVKCFLPKLNKEGLCSDCANKTQKGIRIINKQKKSSTAERSKSTDTVSRTNINRTSDRPHIVNKPPQEKNYALWCMICGFISLVSFFVSIITFDNASKAIKQAKANGESVSGKVWIGVATSVISILFFIFFMFLPMVLD